MIAPRLLIAGICLPFLFSGIAKLLDFNGAVAEFAHFGFAVPALFAALTIALQLGASAAAITLRSKPAVVAALALAAFTVAATLIAHAFWTFEGAARFQQTNIFVEHLSIAFALAFVAWWKWRAA
jgi:transmembrane protein